MKYFKLMIWVMAKDMIFFSCSKDNTSVPDDQATTSFKAQPTTTDFTGTSIPLVPLGSDPNVWYDDAIDEVTGITIWVTEGLEPQPDGITFKLWGTTELFVGAVTYDDVGNGNYDGKWEMKWYGTQTLTVDGFIIVAYAVGVGTEGNVKGLFAEWTYTLNFDGTPESAFYVSEGYIAPKQMTKTMKTIKASGPFAMFLPGHPSNDCDEGICQVYVSGSGNTSHLGKFTVENFGCYDVFGGTGQVGEWLGYITAANGDMIHTELIYSWEADGYDWYLYDILGGTGRFEGASGYIENYGNTDYFNPDNPFEGGEWDLEGEGIIVY